MNKTLKYKLSILSIYAFFSFNAMADKHQLTEHLKVVGQGEMSWLFIDLYQATLYSASGQYEANSYPQALKITYQKDIDKDHLISATGKEWRNLALNNEKHPQWLEKLNQIWTDIKKNDQLLFMIEKNGPCVLFPKNVRRNLI